MIHSYQKVSETENEKSDLRAESEAERDGEKTNLFLAFGLSQVREGVGSISVEKEIASLSNNISGSPRFGFEKTPHVRRVSTGTTRSGD